MDRKKKLLINDIIAIETLLLNTDRFQINRNKSLDTNEDSSQLSRNKSFDINEDSS